MADRKISELAEVEFTGSLGAAFFAYSKAANELGRRLRFELEMAASDSQAAMGTLHGNPLLFGLDVKLRARRVAKRLKRAQELAYGLSEESRKFYDSYRRHFLSNAK
jgi:hypothetical protein